MPIPTPKEVRIYRFQPVPLDAIAVYVEDYGHRASRMTVQCYAQAWTGYWGAHWEEGLEAFVVGCSAEYIAQGLLWGEHVDSNYKKPAAFRARAYVEHIVRAIQGHFKQGAAAKETPAGSCSLGMGCEQAGTCYASAMGDPKQCGKSGQAIAPVFPMQPLEMDPRNTPPLYTFPQAAAK